MPLFQVLNPHVLVILRLARGLIYRMPFFVHVAEIHLLQLLEKMEVVTKTWALTPVQFKCTKVGRARIIQVLIRALIVKYKVAGEELPWGEL